MRILTKWILRLFGVLAFTLAARAIIQLFHELDIYPERGLVSVVMGGRMAIAAWALAGLAGVALLVLWEWFAIGNRLAHLLPASSRRAKIRATLHGFYLKAGELVDRRLPKDISPEAFGAYEAEANAWLNETQQWIGTNLGAAARSRFLDRGAILTRLYPHAANNEHQNIINVLVGFRRNLATLIESEAWDQD